MKKNLVIVNNEKIYKEENNFYCDNLDLKVLPEGLNDFFKVHYIVRRSLKKGRQKVNLESIKVAENIFKFIYFIFKTFKDKNTNYLLISITPYTFFSFLFLFLFRKKIFVYLWSSGHEEWKYILGNWSVWIYHIMYLIVTSGSEVIVCHERLVKKKANLISISRLDNTWFQDYKPAMLNKVKFLYVGRMSPEKGIYNFLEIFDKIKLSAELSIVGNSSNQKIKNKNVNLLGYISEPKSLIETYDDHNIILLPSFTEGYPYVVDESLSRRRPVIIFQDISYIVKDKIGIFVSKRNPESFEQTVKYIMENYAKIQKNIEKNQLPTKKSMLKQISNIIDV
tara:strand:+ start:13137 stop:14147 length:1011 start_codon:yes stop_codon:yes gene_type:complete